MEMNAATAKRISGLDANTKRKHNALHAERDGLVDAFKATQKGIKLANEGFKKARQAIRAFDKKHGTLEPRTDQGVS